MRRGRTQVAAVWNETDAGERLQEMRRFRRQHNVADERDVGAGPRCWAIDRAHDRLWQIADRPNDRIVALIERFPKVGTGLTRRERPVGKVGAGAEASPAPVIRTARPRARRPRATDDGQAS